MNRSADRRAEADWIAALGNLTRLAIIRALATGVKTVTELARECEDEIVNVSHHLGVLRGARLVACERDGREAAVEVDVGGHLDRVAAAVDLRPRPPDAVPVQG